MQKGLRVITLQGVIEKNCNKSDSNIYIFQVGNRENLVSEVQLTVKVKDENNKVPYFVTVESGNILFSIATHCRAIALPTFAKSLFLRQRKFQI